MPSRSLHAQQNCFRWGGKGNSPFFEEGFKLRSRLSLLMPQEDSDAPTSLVQEIIQGSSKEGIQVGYDGRALVNEADARKISEGQIHPLDRETKPKKDEACQSPCGQILLEPDGIGYVNMPRETVVDNELLGTALRKAIRRLNQDGPEV